MTTILKRKEAVTFLKIDSKVFDNFFKNASEFDALPRDGGRGLFKFDQDSLQNWKTNYEWRTVELGLNDYKLCLDFALAMHFRGYVASDWSTSRQREFGQKVTNWVKGQLGEVAFQKFLKAQFGVDVELDFNIYKQIVPQDIIGVFDNGKRRQPKVGIGIKSSKPKSAYLILGEKEVTLPERQSDIYVYCRVDIPDDHLLRIARDDIISAVKGGPLYNNYKNEMPFFSDIKCEIAGWCTFDDLETVTSIPGQTFDSVRKVKQSGRLKRSKQDWEKLISLL
jgi:hypothetical protein